MIRWAILALGLLAGTVGCEESRAQKEIRHWLSIVNASTNEGNIGLQIGYCKNPPRGVPAEGLRRCAEVNSPAAIVIARPGVERAKWPRGSVVYCDWMLDALSFGRRNTPNWVDARDWAVARCCGGLGNSRCDAVSSK